MREPTKPTGLLACLLTAALGWAGCASDEEEPEGGVARIAYSAQPDSLDPAKTYSLEGAAIVWTVYTGPLTYRHADGRAGTDVVPGLAEEPLEIDALCDPVELGVVVVPIGHVGDRLGP